MRPIHLAALAATVVLSSTSVARAEDGATRARRYTQRGEVIHLEEPPPPVVRPKLKKKSRKLPPYSDAAFLQDAWTRAWMLLEVGETGTVTRLKVLRQPGYDLDDIAVREAFALRFEPALDAQGRPMRVWIVWGFEWPAQSWLVAMTGLGNAMPPDVGFPPRPAHWYIPCRGSGPMRLGSIYKGYRDCSRPDLTHLAALPWVQRP